jgi:N-acetylglucosamine kinase-like BadF-type ATPase
MRCILAVDSGGTKCDALLARDDGTAIGWGRSGLGDANHERAFPGVGRSETARRAAVAKAMGAVTCDELHLIGTSDACEANLFPARSRFTLHAYPASEAVPAFELAEVAHGIVALAGTGAFVHGRTRNGRGMHLDGLGPLLGDRGGGHQIGLMAIRATAQARWHRRHNTSLAQPVLRACGGYEKDTRGGSLIGYKVGERDRAEVAALARLVDQEARSGDAVASGILATAAKDLAETAYDVVDRLRMAHDEYPLIGTGGVIHGSDIYWEHFCARVHEFAPRFRPIRLDKPPVLGLALSVLRELRGVDFTAARATLYKTFQRLRAPAAPKRRRA